MIYTLRMCHPEYSDRDKLYLENLEVHFKSIETQIQDTDFIINTIVETQRDGRLVQKWIDCKKNTCIKTLSNSYTQYSLYNICEGDITYIQLKLSPSYIEELDFFIKMAIGKGKPNYIKNSLIKLPVLREFIDQRCITELKDYVISDCISLHEPVKENLYWYAFKKSDLNKAVVTLYVPSNLFLKVIGKGGIRVKSTISNLRKAGYTKVHSLNIRKLP